MKKIIVFVIAIVWMNEGFGQIKTSFTTNDYVRALKHTTDVMVNVLMRGHNRL